MARSRPFPQRQADFAADPRISFYDDEDKWILEDDDGHEWQWQARERSWAPANPHASHDTRRDGGLGEEALGGAESGRTHQLTTREHQQGRDVEAQAKPRPKKEPKKEPVNTAIYITSLPLDVTVDEVHDTFKRCGIVAEEVDSGQPRIKLYTDKEGKFNGEALVVYFKPESIRLAVQMLDETDFRLGEEGPLGKMRVTEADRSYKKQNYAAQPAGEAGAGEGGAEGEVKSKKRKAPSKDQKKIIQKTQKLNDKIADWSSGDEVSAVKQTSSRFDKVVVMKHMFSIEELEANPAEILDLKEDIREECSKLGQVTNVVLYDREADGVVTVRFSTVEAANACVRAMHGRWFDKKEVVAYIADGNERFKKSSRKVVVDASSDDSDEEQRRLDKFGAFLEGKEDGGAPAKKAKTDEQGG